MNLVRMAESASLRLGCAPFVNPRDLRIRVTHYEIRLNVGNIPIAEINIHPWMSREVRNTCYYRQNIMGKLLPSEIRGVTTWV